MNFVSGNLSNRGNDVFHYVSIIKPVIFCMNDIVCRHSMFSRNIVGINTKFHKHDFIIYIYGVRCRNDRASVCTNMFHSPCCISFSGMSGSGKTSLLYTILKHRKDLFSSPPEKIMYCYGVWQKMFESMERELPV